MTTILDLSKPVKFIEPINEAEAQLIFEVVNYNEVTNRCYIRPLNMGDDMIGKSQQLVSVEWIVNVE